MRTGGPGSGERGFALLIVLWTVVLLAFLAAHLTASGGTEVQRVTNLRDSAVAQAAADGAVYETLFYLAEAGARRGDLGGLRRVNFSQARVDVRIEDLAGRINLNTAPLELLAALFTGLGVTPSQADALAVAIADWRSPRRRSRIAGTKLAEYAAAGRVYGPPGEPFQSPDELGDVLGMNPALLAAVRPYVSTWGGDDPDPVRAGPVVRSALEAVGIRASPGRGTESNTLTLAITADATGPAASRFVRYAVVQIVFDPGNRPCRILAWAQGDAS